MRLRRRVGPPSVQFACPGPRSGCVTQVGGPTANPLAERKRDGKVKPFEIFSTGEHIDMNGRAFLASSAVLAELAESYDPALSEAPLVIGHPDMDAPAYGWVKSLRVDGDQLVAEPHQLQPEFSQMVADGRFKNRSVSFYQPDQAGNPKPGKHYIKHVGFLGAAAPAVKGLKAVQFSGESKALSFMTEWRDPKALDDAEEVAGLINSALWLLRKMFRVAGVSERIDGAASFAAAEAEARTVAAPQPALETDTAPETNTTPEETSVDAKELKAAREKLKAEQAAFAEQVAQHRRAEDEAAVDAAIDAGRLAPARRDEMVSFMQALPDGNDAAFSFAGADGEAVKTTPRARFAAMLAAATPIVSFAEVSADDAAGKDDTPVDPVALAERARAFQQEQAAKGVTVSITKAVEHVGRDVDA